VALVIRLRGGESPAILQRFIFTGGVDWLLSLAVYAAGYFE